MEGNMYDNYVFDLYGTLVDIHTEENDAKVWEKLSLFYGFYGALYDPQELQESYLALIQSKETDLKGELEKDRKSTRLNSSHSGQSRMPSSA